VTVAVLVAMVVVDWRGVFSHLGVKLLQQQTQHTTRYHHMSHGPL
jgi:hypothetical protein